MKRATITICCLILLLGLPLILRRWPRKVRYEPPSDAYFHVTIEPVDGSTVTINLPTPIVLKPGQACRIESDEKLQEYVAYCWETEAPYCLDAQGNHDTSPACLGPRAEQEPR